MSKKAADAQLEDSVVTDLPPTPLVTITFAGRDWTFPRDRQEWPGWALYAASKGDSLDFVKWLIGDSQFDLLMQLPQREIIGEFFPLFNAAVLAECVN